MNEALVSLQDLLVKQHHRLRDRLEEAKKEEVRSALIREMGEITHRVQLVGGLLFAAEAEKLDAKVAEVRKGTAMVKAALDNLKELQGVLDAVTGFLELVDEAIDIAKSLSL